MAADGTHRPREQEAGVLRGDSLHDDSASGTARTCLAGRSRTDRTKTPVPGKTVSPEMAERGPPPVAASQLQLRGLAHLGIDHRLIAPDRPDGEHTTRDTRSANDHVAAGAHHGTYGPAHELFGRVEFAPVGMPESLKLRLDEGKHRPDRREALSREGAIFRVADRVVDDGRQSLPRGVRPKTSNGVVMMGAPSR